MNEGAKGGSVLGGARACAPVLMLVFNRLEPALKVVDSVRSARPRKLYIASDGGRDPEEREQVERIRSSVLDRIDWNCDVKTLFRGENLGCLRAVSEAVSWFFDQEAWGIVLEDDCVPHPDFFSYCSEMLDRYSKSEDVASIGGSRFFCYDEYGREGRILASRVFHCWGWGSWAGKWNEFHSPLPKRKDLVPACSTERELSYWQSVSEICGDEASQSWAYRFSLACFAKGWRHVVPPVNLVLNHGFSGRGTHARRRPWIVPKRFDSEEAIERALESPEFCWGECDDSYYSTQFRAAPVRWAFRIRSAILRGRLKR